MSARPEEMAAEFNELLRDPEVRAIFAATGGRATLAYLDLIDFDAVLADPKPILGFSDISTLHLALHARTGLVAIHSDLVTWGFGIFQELPERSARALVDAYRRILTSEAPLGALPAAGEWETWRPGRADGPLIDGLLNRVLGSGTPFAVPLERFDGASSSGRRFARRRHDLVRPPCAAIGRHPRPDRRHGRRDADRHGDRGWTRRCARSCSTSSATATSPSWATSTSATARQTPAPAGRPGRIGRRRRSLSLLEGAWSAAATRPPEPDLKLYPSPRRARRIWSAWSCE